MNRYLLLIPVIVAILTMVRYLSISDGRSENFNRNNDQDDPYSLAPAVLSETVSIERAHPEVSNPHIEEGGDKVESDKRKDNNDRNTQKRKQRRENDIIEEHIEKNEKVAFKYSQRGKKVDIDTSDSYKNDAKDKNDPSKKYRFQKISYNGDLLENDAEDWSCVYDHKTKLFWEVKSYSPGLHDKLDTYVWFRAKVYDEGEDPGQPDGIPNSCSFYDDSSRNSHIDDNDCNTQVFWERVNKENFCGIKDWRVPSDGELKSIVHSSYMDPAIDLRYFPNTQSDYYWSSAVYAMGRKNSWAVSFYRGSVDSKEKTNAYYVRLVSSEPLRDDSEDL